ncbi:hypothetical protein BB561_006097 [Smittium simulii]|uniref:beta-glucosidase n=1 Tax=Smittium simulii TaxID=133385 RepID=A0A2T9Y6J4_9FUNG|nr:hypothetical protein BB561_006097 [Smittium simulii]
MKLSLYHILVSVSLVIEPIYKVNGELKVGNKAPIPIPVAGPRKIGNTVCLPDNFLQADLDPTPFNPVQSYSIEKFDESKYIGPEDKIDEDVEALLKTLTVEQKVGQMTQITHTMFIGCDGTMNKTAMEYYFDKYSIGSVLHYAHPIKTRWSYWSAERYANFTNTLQEYATSKGAKIPMIYGIDSVKGAALIRGAVVLPTGFNIAATFNRSIAYEWGRITAKDTRAGGAQWAFGPLADINTQKQWARNFENFGEDPFHNGEMVHYSVKGYQGDYKKDRTRVAGCVKHFIGYSSTHNGKDQEPRYIPMNELMEYHVPSFQRAFDAGVASVMEAYAATNGEDVVASNMLLRKLLREKMKFKGMMVTDYDEINSQYLKHKTAKDAVDAAYITLNQTSVDMSMVGEGKDFADGVIDLVKKGKISESRIDESVRRILQFKKDLGMFEQPFSDPKLIETVGSKQDIDASREFVRESLVLLKNENNILPLKQDENVLFIGANVNSTSYLCGAWSFSAIGPTKIDGDTVYQGYGDTIASGVEMLTKKPINWIQGYDIYGNRVSDYDEIVRLARKADKVVFSFGEDTLTEVLADIETLNLNPEQYNIVERVAKETSTPITLLLVQNRPYSLGKLSTYADSIINVGIPGAYAGLPIAELLYGKFSPSARMPFTYPKKDYQAAVKYYTPIWNEYKPEFAYGAGFGYNNVTYSNVTVSSNELRPGKPITVSVTATNNGKMEQKETAIMYTTQNIRHIHAPERMRVRNFDKKILAPGTSATFEFKLTAEEFKFWTAELNHILEGGPVTITINAGNKNAVKTQIELYKD